MSAVDVPKLLSPFHFIPHQASYQPTQPRHPRIDPTAWDRTTAATARFQSNVQPYPPPIPISYTSFDLRFAGYPPIQTLVWPEIVSAPRLPPAAQMPALLPPPRPTFNVSGPSELRTWQAPGLLSERLESLHSPWDEMPLEDVLKSEIGSDTAEGWYTSSEIEPRPQRNVDTSSSMVPFLENSSGVYTFYSHTEPVSAKVPEVEPSRLRFIEKNVLSPASLEASKIFHKFYSEESDRPRVSDLESWRPRPVELADSTGPFIESSRSLDRFNSDTLQDNFRETEYKKIPDWCGEGVWARMLPPPVPSDDYTYGEVQRVGGGYGNAENCDHGCGWDNRGYGEWVSRPRTVQLPSIDQILPELGTWSKADTLYGIRK